MAFINEKDGEHRRKSEPDEIESDHSEKPARGKKRTPVPEVGSALRTAYEQTVNEDIPPEMLDLLGKLG